MITLTVSLSMSRLKVDIFAKNLWILNIYNILNKDKYGD